MNKEIERNYLEISSLEELKESNEPSKDYFIKYIKPADFQLNKFFYKRVGKKHHWVDRLEWSNKKWIDYVSDEKVKTYVLIAKDDLAGYFEQIYNEQNNEYEIAYFGILEEFRSKKYGSYLLSNAIKSKLKDGAKRVWVHTCSLDHENALKNYLARGMKVFKEEKIKISA